MLCKGCDKKYGDIDDNIMVVLLEFGIGMKIEGGTFNVTMCDLTSQLMQWSAQTKLEMQIAVTYEKDLYFMDTTNNATKSTFKSGPIVSLDCGLFRHLWALWFVSNSRRRREFNGPDSNQFWT